MTTITANAADVTMVDDNTSWTFYTQVIRESDDGTIITTKKVRKYPVAGVLTVVLDPGPAVVLAPDGKTYPFTVPDVDSQLWPLIQAAVTIPPTTTHQQLVDAVDAWLDLHGAGAFVDPLTTKGDLLVRTASATTRKAAGTDGGYLRACASRTDGLLWSPRKTFDLDFYDADPSGGTFSDAARDALRTEMGTNRGIVELGSGTYKFNTTTTLDHPGQGIIGPGEGAAIIDYRGTGDCIRMWDSVHVGDGFPGHAGPVMGLEIFGWNNANTNTSGLHIGDLNFIYIEDVNIAGFSHAGCKGLWAENTYTQSERAYMQMTIDGCTDGAVFETNASNPLGRSSWSYGTFNLVIHADPNCNALTLKNSVGISGADFMLTGNCIPGASNTGVALTIGTTGSDTSSIENSHVVVSMETTGGTGTGHKDINIGTVARLKGVGALVFPDFGGIPFTAGTASSSTVEFAGRIRCPSLGNVASEAFRTVGNASMAAITDGSGNKALEIAGVASAVNWLRVRNAAAGAAPGFFVEGADPNTDMAFVSAGLGGLYWYQSSGSFRIIADGADPTVDVNVIPKGPDGQFKVNGEPVAKRGFTTTATAAGTTTLTITSTTTQVFTGTTTQTVKLPTTSVPQGAQYRIVNQSTGAVTVQSSGANTIATLPAGTAGLFTAVVATPTTAANWDISTPYVPSLTNPKINQILDSNGNVVAGLQANASAVNYLGWANRAAGAGPYIFAAGSDPNVPVIFVPQGNAGLGAYSNDAGVTAIPFAADGANGSVGWNFTTTGSAPVQINGIPVGAATISAASASSLTPAVASANLYAYTALAANLAINAPTGTPTDGQPLDFRFKDNGTTRTLTWNAIFRIIGTTLPTATAANKTVYVRTKYNAADTKFDVIDVKQEA